MADDAMVPPRKMPADRWATDADYIAHVLMPEARELFLRKSADYNAAGLENHRILGTMGQFADIWRKIMKLKAALWDRQTLTGEQPREILLDLIGHCYLALAMIDRPKGTLSVRTPQEPDDGAPVT